MPAATSGARPARSWPDEDSNEISTFTDIIRNFLLAFAGIALFVGAFVIFNTLSITVAQRTREFATLRTIGASRRQVLGSVVLEALVIGVGGLVIGLLARPRARQRPERALRRSDRPAADADGPRARARSSSRSSSARRDARSQGSSRRSGRRACRRSRPCARGDAAARPLAPFTPYIAGGHRRARGPRSSATGRSSTKSATSDRFALLGVGVHRALHRRRDAFVSARPAARDASSAGRRAGSAARRASSPRRTRGAIPAARPSTAAALMIGIALVTFVAVLARACRPRTARRSSGRSRPTTSSPPRTATRRSPPRPGDAVEDAQRRRDRQHVRQDIAQGRGTWQPHRGRPSTIDDVYDFQWERGLGRAARRARRNGAVLPRRLRRGQRPRRRRHVPGAARRTTSRGSRSGDLRAPPLRSAARQRRASRRRRSTQLFERRATSSPS